MSSQSSMTTSRNQSTDTDEKCLMGPDTGSTTCSSYTTVSGRRTSQKSFAKLSSFINVTQIYEGTKTFSRDRIKVHLIMFEHKFVSPNGQSPCIEVVSYVYDDVGSSVPRLFLSADKIFGRLRGTLNVKGSRHTQESVVSYIFTRLSITKRNGEFGNDPKYHIELERKSDDLSTDDGHTTNAEYEGEIFLGPLPEVENVSYPFGDVRDPKTSPIELEWGRKLDLFKKFQTECNGAVLRASLLSTSTTDAIATFMGQAHQTSVSLPHRRWQKAIRSVIRKINVRKITLKLYDIEMSHGLGLLSSSDDVGTTLQYASDEEHGSTSPLFFKLPSVTNLERDRSSLGEIFMDRPARSEDSAESSDLIPNITSFSEKASSYNKQKKSPDTKPLFLEYLKRRSQSNAQNFKSNTFKQKIVVSDSLSKDGKKLPSSTHSPTRARSLTMNHADAALFSPMFIRKSEDTSPVQRASSSEECYSPLKSLSPRLLQSGQDIALSSPRALLVKADSISPSMLPITVGTSIPPSLQQASVRASRDSGDIGLISVIEKSSSKTKFPTVHATKSETSDKVGKLQSIPLRRKSIKL